MATEYLREKINMLQNLIQNEELQLYQHQLMVEDASDSCGDAQVDATIKAQAQNAQAVILAGQRRLTVRKQKLSDLQSELNQDVQT